ncbi:MAG: hypothetical protein KGJ66_01295 [Alphaproteobacteria bacterium]|nr:hypothetical protein [Alphaproteobacteria bacterium]
MKRPDSVGRLNRRLALVAVMALPVLLGGCFGKTNAEGPTCPGGSAVPALDVAPQFGPGPGRTQNDVVAAARILAVKTKCSEEKSGVRVDVDVAFSVVRGSSRLQDAQFTYFVAVVDSRSNILNEQRFVLPVHFAGAETFKAMDDQITVHLPLQNVSEGQDFGIVGGFQLTQDQIRFNNAQQTPPAQ